MKNVLYVSNFEVPYRVRFFNEFSKRCNLTVVYGRKKASSRNETWASREQSGHKTVHLKGIKVGAEDSFSLGILKHVFSKKYDAVILGCYNSVSQMVAILAMRLARKPYILNIDGEVFISGKGLKNKIKRFFLSGAAKYLAAGEKAAESIKPIAGNKEVIPYYFSSMSDYELKENAEKKAERNGPVLVVAQYHPVKGLDVVLEAAKMNEAISYRLIGAGNRTEEFVERYQVNSIKNVEVIPFLQKEQLEKEYLACSLFVLPSRQECWGLVINEAASFGTPIVSTFGSGAAVEFLSDGYSQYLAAAGDPLDLYEKINAALQDENSNEYSKYLIQKSSKYSIERAVDAHCVACDVE